MKITSLLSTNGFITVNKELIRTVGLHEAILLGCLCSKQDYWTDREGLTDDGYFFCTVEQFEEETTLSKYFQQKAFKTLEDRGLIKTKKMGLPAKKYFKVVSSMVATLFTDCSESGLPIEVNPVACNNIKTNKIKPNNINSEVVNSNDSTNDVISYLNYKTNSNFRNNTDNNVKLINARLKEGYTVEDLKKVIDIKANEWVGTDFEKYLRPQTLFAPGHFDTYLNQKPIKQKSYMIPTTKPNSELDVMWGAGREIELSEDTY